MESQLFIIHWHSRPSDASQPGEPSSASNVLLKRNRVPWAPGLPVVTHLTLASTTDTKQLIIRFKAHCLRNTPFTHSTHVPVVLFHGRTSARPCTRQRLGCGPCIPDLVDEWPLRLVFSLCDALRRYSISLNVTLSVHPNLSFPTYAYKPVLYICIATAALQVGSLKHTHSHI